MEKNLKEIVEALEANGWRREPSEVGVHLSLGTHVISLSPLDVYRFLASLDLDSEKVEEEGQKK